MADQKKTYTVTTATTPARPRSKARREGTGLTASGTTAIIENTTAGNAQRASYADTAAKAEHARLADEAAHANSAKTAEHATTADRAATATRADEAIHADTATNATTADRAATAARADHAQRATEAETLRTPNYSDGLHTGAGARIDATGNAEFQSMAVRGFFRATEYQINRIALSEGDVFHTENGLVKSAERQADGRWKVVLQERFQGDVTGFRVGDILRGAYNGIGTSGGAAEIRISWLRVEAVDAKAGVLTASLYADNQTPEGRNAPPIALMRLARWGNTTDPARQSHIMESATDGRIVRRVKVSAPIVDGVQSDGFVVGKLPAWLRSHFGAAVADASDYVFARGIITQNILRYTPAGRPLAERVDRGLWSASSRYFYEQQNPETGAFEISRVWHDGALYELARGGNGKTVPGAQSTHWTLIQAKPKDGSDGKKYNTNFIDNSSFQKGTKGWDTEQMGGVLDDSLSAPVVGTRAIKFEVKRLREHDYAGISQDVSSYDLPPNTLCTLSVWVRATSGLRQAALIVTPNLYSRPWAGKDIVKGKEGWQLNVLKFTTPKDVRGKPIRVYMLLYNQEEDATVWFAAPKLEIGDTPTEWTTSENDRKGEKGEKGNDGRGIERVETFYLLTTENTAPNHNTQGWTTKAPMPTPQKPWLWSYERTVYSDRVEEPTAVRLIGHYGKDGANGTSIRAQYSADARTWHDVFVSGDVWMRTGNGTTWGGALRVVGESGADGKSPVYDFAASTQLATASGTTPPSIRGTWQDAPPTLRDGEVLWYRLTAANGKITYGRLSGEKGKNSYTHIAYANSDDGEKDFTTEEDLDRDAFEEFCYFGIYSDFYESASQDYQDYVWTRLRGVDGKDGLTPNANLLDDTDFKNLGHKESAWGVGTFGEEPIGGRANADLFPPSVSGCFPALCSINPGTKQGEFAQLWQNIGRLIPGRTYTFSVYVRGASDAWLIVYPTPSEHFHPDTVKRDEWTRVSLTFTVPKTKATEDTLIILRAWHREEQPHKGFAKSVVWCAPKLEEGETPTPWCPSRNDLRGKDGKPGTRGAAVRFLGDYDRLPSSTAFESGHTGEQYVDVVQVRQGAQVQYYQCKQPHTKSTDKAPTADSEWWELGMYQGFIATDLLLAERSLIKNLQVENVVGRDANGNTTFDLDASTGTTYFGGTATFAGFVRRRPVVITPDNWQAYGGKIESGVIYLNPFHVGTYVIFRGNFGALRPTVNTGPSPLNEGVDSVAPDDSQAMRYYGAQFMVFNDLEPRPSTFLEVGGLTIGSKQAAIFTMKGRNRSNPTLWWQGELLRPW